MGSGGAACDNMTEKNHTHQHPSVMAPTHPTPLAPASTPDTTSGATGGATAEARKLASSRLFLEFGDYLRTLEQTPSASSTTSAVDAVKEQIHEARFGTARVLPLGWEERVRVAPTCEMANGVELSLVTAPTPTPTPLAPAPTPLARVLVDPDLVDALVDALEAPALRTLRVISRALRDAVAPRLKSEIDAANAEYGHSALAWVKREVAQHVGDMGRPQHALQHVRMSLSRALADDVSGKLLIRFFRRELEVAYERQRPGPKRNGELQRRLSQIRRDVMASNVVRAVAEQLAMPFDARELVRRFHALEPTVRTRVAGLASGQRLECPYEKLYFLLDFTPRHAPTTEKQMHRFMHAYEMLRARHMVAVGWAPPPFEPPPPPPPLKELFG